MKTYKLFTSLLTLLLATVQASQISDQELNNNNNTKPDPEKKDLELQKGIEKYLPQFFENNQTMLERLQEGKRQAVVVIGQTGAGKSTLIGSLMGQKFKTEKKQVTKTLKNGHKMYFNEEVLVNTNSYAPKIGHNTTTSETTWPSAHLDKKTNLAFIDTAGLVDTRNDGQAINLCNAIGLRSFIEKIGSIQCIIGVISYNTFIEGRGSNVFVTLLNATSSMLKNTSTETLTSSMVLVFTKVPNNIKKEDIKDKLEDRCHGLEEKKNNKQMTEEDKVKETMYKTLFPSCYGLEHNTDVPFFLISEASILQQGLVRNTMLPSLQNATKVDKKDIGLVLTPYLLQKTRDWLAKRAQPVANDIREQKKKDKKIKEAQEKCKKIKKQLKKDENTLKNLTDSNNQNKKETFKKSLKETIKNNTKRIQELDLAIKNNKNEVVKKETKIQTLDTNQVILHTTISGSYSEYSKQYNYSYSDVPINHILYGNRITKKYEYEEKDPYSGDRVSSNYKVVSITKNYHQGKLNISLENDVSAGHWAAAGLGTVMTLGVGSLLLGSLLIDLKYADPKDFYIYAKKKDIYQNDIKTLRNDIENLQEVCSNKQNEKKCLEKDLQLSEYYLQQFQSSNNLTKDQLKNNKFGSETLQKVSSNLLQEKQMITKTKQDIKDTNKAIEDIQSNLTNLKKGLEQFNEKIKKNAIIPYIITQVNPFIGFNKSNQNNINICKQYYINNLKKYNQGNNNTNNKHSDYQPGGKLEERKEDDDCDNNNNNSSSLTSSILLGTTIVSGSLLKKKN